MWNYTITFSRFLNATPPAISTGCTYQFKLIDQSDFSEIESAEIADLIKIYNIPGHAYGKTYKASVRVPARYYGGIWSFVYVIYGKYPYKNTRRTLTLDNCDVNIPTFTQRLYAFAIPGGKYQFEIDNGSVTIKRIHQKFRLSEVAGYVQELILFIMCAFRVSMDDYSSYGPWGDVCTATTPAAIMEPDEDYLRESQGEHLQLTISEPFFS